MLQIIINWIVYSLIGLDSTSRLGQSINFFLYDIIKISLLLFVMITIVGFFRTYLPQQKIKKWLSNTKFGIGNIGASLFGAITPFCSCSSIPMFLGFINAGVPLGVTFSFLITSPLVNEYLVVLMLGFFGWKITIAYILSGVIIGTVSGIILGKMNLEKHLVKDLVLKNKNIKDVILKSIKDRLKFGLNEAWNILKKIWIWLIVGVGLGAIIHNYIPEQLIHNVINTTGIFGVLIAVIVGVPMYGSCAAIVPIALALFQKGIPLGTALAFMMAISALSLPEAIILRRAMKLRLILIFFSIVTIGIILTGYLFNILQQLFMI